MLFSKKVLVILAMLILTSSSFALVDAVGSDATHDIITWNMREFPTNGTMTINYLYVLINDLNVDMVFIQEISDDDALEQLASNLGWNVEYTIPYYGLACGFLYDDSKVELTEVEELWTGDGARFAFPRAPLKAHVRMIENGDTLEFNAINVHLKAGAANLEDNLERRRAGCDSLKTYIERQIEETGDYNWIIGGDLNDTLDDSYDFNAFNVFIDDSADWYFMTQTASSSGVGSYIGTDRVIDHFITTIPFRNNEYLGGGHTDILTLDEEWNASLYNTNISDHRPVGAFFPGMEDDIDEETTGNVIPQDMSLSIWPVPANGNVTVTYEFPSNARAKLQVYNIMGQTVLNRNLEKSRGIANWDATFMPSGVYFVRLLADKKAVVRRAIIVK